MWDSGYLYNEITQSQWGNFLIWIAYWSAVHLFTSEANLPLLDICDFQNSVNRETDFDQKKYQYMKEKRKKKKEKRKKEKRAHHGYVTPS